MYLRLGFAGGRVGVVSPAGVGSELEVGVETGLVVGVVGVGDAGVSDGGVSDGEEGSAGIAVGLLVGCGVIFGAMACWLSTGGW